MTKMIRVGVNGYGVIGARVADAVRKQPDMTLVGVCDLATDYRVKAAAALGLPVYAAQPAHVDRMRAAGIPVVGPLHDLLKGVDVVVDCTPQGTGCDQWGLYRLAGVKAIFQGGERHALTGHSFVAQANYASAVGRDETRVVSCNTTGIVRALGALQQAKLLKRARGVLIRRAADPWQADHAGIMNTVVPEARFPSHQTADAKSVLPDLDVVTLAATAAHTQSHLHLWTVDLARPAGREEVLAAFRAAPRIAMLRVADGVVGLNSTAELLRLLDRPRGELWEVGLWEDTLAVAGDELYFAYQVGNEAIVVPENIDAIRALTGAVTDAAASIAMTDRALGIRRDLLNPPVTEPIAVVPVAPLAVDSRPPAGAAIR